MVRFNSDEYLLDYQREGKYPEIHDDIFKLIEKLDCKRAVDLGCCYGLISKRLVDKAGYEAVVGIERNRSYLQHALMDDRVRYYLLDIHYGTLRGLADIIEPFQPDIIIARRIFPEIAERGIGVAKEAVKVLYASRARYVAIEGRIKTGRATNILSDINKEIAIFEPYFKEQAGWNNCRLLARNDEVI